MHEIIKVTITDGVPVVQVQGVKGNACRKLTAALEKALGDVANIKSTPEMYEQAKQNIKAGR